MNTLPHTPLAQAGHFLLNSDNYLEITGALNVLHAWCAKFTGISAGNIEDEDVYLASGKAISPTKAAHCLLEPDRTRKFLRGIYQAILDLKEIFPGQRIHILYAGTGPYSTLILPLLPFFKPEEIGIYMMDINPVSFNALKNMYTQNQMQEYVLEWIEGDAAIFCTEERTIHLMISETMQNALKREPQVAIMRNLIPQLQPQGIFIPQEISVDAYILDYGQETRRLTLPDFCPERKYLGNIFTIRKEKLEHDVSYISIPAYESTETLNYITDIVVYKQHKLKLYECSLTLPQVFSKKENLSNKTLLFKYRTDNVPRFDYEVR